MKFFRNPWFMIFAILLLISFIPLLLNFLPKPSGVVVISVENPSCTFGNGDVITEIRGKSIKNSQDFYSIQKELKKGEYVSMVVNGGPGGCKVIEDGELGIKVSDIERRKMKLSIEFGGGKKIFLSTNQSQEMVEVLKKRIELLGLPETKVNISNSLVEIICPKYVNLDKLLSRGEFKATIEQELEIENESVEVKIGTSKYSFLVNNSTIVFQNQKYREGKVFYIDGIEIEILNITNHSVLIEEKIFDNKDVVRVFKELGSVRYNPSARSYEFSIPIELSENASERIIKVTRGLKTTLVRDELIFQGFLVYYLDGEKISSLVVPFRVTLEGIKNINILGFSKSSKDALKKMTLIEISLEAGSLPEFQIVKEVKFEGSSKLLLQISYISFGIAALSLLTLSSLTLKRKGFWIFLISLSTSFIVFGLALISQLISQGIIIDKNFLFGLLAIPFLNFFNTYLFQKKKRKYTKFLKIGILTISIIFLLTAKNLGISLFLFLILTPITENLSRSL